MPIINYVWKTAEEKSSVSQTKMTEKEITKEEVEKIINKYDWYSYDNRFDALRFIRKKHIKKGPLWLHLYLVIKLWEETKNM